MFKGCFPLLFLVIFAAFGCAPDSSSSNQENNSQPTLPERPSKQNEIFSRDLLYKNDPRISYCEMIENQNSSYSGMRDLSLQPLASLSKVVTTAWVLDKLGTDFRFQTEIYLQPVSEKGVFDVYLKTNWDPVVNIEKLLYFIVLMNQKGVNQIRNLVIDESTRIFLGVLSNPHLELENTPISTGESIENLQLIFNSKNWAEKTSQAKENLLEWSKKTGKSIQIPDKFAVVNVLYRKSKEIGLKDYSMKMVIPSAPMFKYLKNINVYSNNYLADAFFNYLGGAKAFTDFQLQQLKISSKDLLIYTGSGLSDSSSGSRKDNLGTCFSMIKVLSYVRQKAKSVQLNLGSLLLNPSLDLDGTFDPSETFQNAVVLKTGRLYEVPALNLAGYVATEAGLLNFVFLGHDFSDVEGKEIENYRSQMLEDIYSNYKVRSEFNTIDYSSIFF